MNHLNKNTRLWYTVISQKYTKVWFHITVSTFCQDPYVSGFSRCYKQDCVKTSSVKKSSAKAPSTAPGPSPGDWLPGDSTVSCTESCDNMAATCCSLGCEIPCRWLPYLQQGQEVWIFKKSKVLYLEPLIHNPSVLYVLNQKDTIYSLCARDPQATLYHFVAILIHSYATLPL